MNRRELTALLTRTRDDLNRAIEALSAGGPATAPAEREPVDGDAPDCGCNEPAKLLEKVGKNGKPYTAYACARPKDQGCGFWQFVN